MDRASGFEPEGRRFDSFRTHQFLRGRLAISIEEYEDALNSLEEAINLHSQSNLRESEKNAFRDACIQRFEFSIELAWKISRKIMGTSSQAPNTVIREMAQNNLIDDPKVWFEFIDARNKTSHTYDEDIARQVYAVILKFIPEAKKLLVHLKK